MSDIFLIVKNEIPIFLSLFLEMSRFFRCGRESNGQWEISSIRLCDNWRLCNSTFPRNWTFDSLWIWFELRSLEFRIWIQGQLLIMSQSEIISEMQDNVTNNLSGQQRYELEVGCQILLRKVYVIFRTALVRVKAVIRSQVRWAKLIFV